MKVTKFLFLLITCLTSFLILASGEGPGKKFRWKIERLEGVLIETERYSLVAEDGETYASWKDVLGSTRLSSFVKSLNKQLKNSSLNPFFFEAPPLSEKTLDQKFEFVLVQRETQIARKIGKSPLVMKALSNEEGDTATTFSAKDDFSRFLLPTAKAHRSEPDYFHSFSDFIKEASEKEIFTFWSETFLVLLQELEFRSEEKEPKVWLSSHGDGSKWVMMRFDSVGRLYSFGAYRKNF